jgi:DNA-binding NarL/FixJ family response regulator
VAFVFKKKPATSSCTLSSTTPQPYQYDKAVKNWNILVDEHGIGDKPHGQSRHIPLGSKPHNLGIMKLMKETLTVAGFTEPGPNFMISPITVLLVDDHDLVRAGLRALLETAPDIKVVGEAENGRQAVCEAQRLRPEVILLDCAMPLLNGLETTRQLTAELPTAKVLMLSSYHDAEHLQRAVEAGAAGYLTKETAARDLLEAVRETRNGGASFSPAVSNHLLKQWRGESPGRESAAPKPAVLSFREAEILQLIAEGYCNKEIGGLLAISTKTVDHHRLSLMKKLAIHKTAGLTRYAVSNGMVESNRPPTAAQPDSPTLAGAMSQEQAPPETGQ